MEPHMDQFVHFENLKIFRRLLAETKDKVRRVFLTKLIEEEESKKTLPPK
jgi:hypothetical protein